MILIFLAICITAYAQKEPKPKTPNVDKAKTMLDKGDLQGAKAIIDDALTFDKTKDKAKTQYYAGLLYESIYYQQDSAHLATIDSMAYEKCVQAFKKVKTLENQLGAYYNFAEIRLNKMYSYIFNRAAKEYQNQ